MGEAAAPEVSAIANHLADNALRYQAIIALERIGMPECYQQLLGELDRTWDMELASRLCHQSRVREAVIERILNRLQNLNISYLWGKPNDAALFLRLSSDHVISEVLKKLPGLADCVREAAFADEGSFLITGSKADAIRALGALDSDAGFSAARRTLTDYRARARQVYPPLLYRINTEAAREVFLDLAKVEKDVSVIWSMARMFQKQDTQWLCEHLSHASGLTRLGACRLAAIAASDIPGALDLVTKLLDDPVEAVRRAAEQCRRNMRARELVTDIEIPSSEWVKNPWLLLDAALQVGDAGFKGAPWPVWAERLASHVEGSQPALREILVEEIKKQRKKASEDAVRATAQ
jgi:hypothetical protein